MNTSLPQFRFVPFHELRRPTALAKTTARDADAPAVEISDEAGFHVYSRIRMTLALDAAGSDARMKKFLRIASSSAELAAAFAKEAGGRILEHQGETLHMFFPSGHGGSAPGGDTVQMLACLLAYRNALQKHVKGLAGDDWRSLRMTMDHGNSILLGTSRNCDDSIISLAPAANRPAKEFGRDSEIFPSDSIRLPLRLLSGSPSLRDAAFGAATRGNEEWVSIPFPAIADEVERNSESRIIYHAALAQIEGHGKRLDFSPSHIQTRASITAGVIDAPAAVRGWVLRADLDGFSRGVDAAFAPGSREQGLRQLVSEFLTRMEDATAFDTDCPWPQMLPMPWAGDCAARIVCSDPPDEYHQHARGRSAKIGLRWHNQARYPEWLVSVAGGDASEGNGHILVADIIVDGNRFRIAAGWPVRRSKQGEQDAGGNRTETIVHKLDRGLLESPWRECFKGIEGLNQFRVSTIRRLRDAAGAVATQASMPRALEQMSAPAILAPKPYGIKR